MTNKIGALVVDVAGKDLAAEDKELLAHPLVGGVILFARNYESYRQLQNLCQQIRATRRMPLIIMVDQEGGRVQRFINEFTRLPYMAVFGKMYAEDPIVACQRASDCAWLMATELLAAGVDLSLAPVLDLNKNISNVIGDRAFAANPAIVIELASAFMRGMREAGMAATGKHFPGHGSINVDSHVAIPVDQRSLSAIMQEDIVPFAGLIAAGISAMMAAHIIFPQIDKQAVGFSRIWLHDILRIKLGFNGVIFSDDLNMEGANISAHYADRVVAAREAGCDFALLCNNRDGVIQVLDNLTYESHQLDQTKWGILQGQFSHLKVPFNNQPRWQKTHGFLQELQQSVQPN